MKQIVKKFNNLVKKTIFKVQNKTNNKFIISSFNKYLITFIGLLFFYLFYLLIPLLYDKNWVQNNIEGKILNKFKIKINTSSDISYRILPSPHFLIKNSKILLDNSEIQKSIAEVRSLKVFLSQKNLFDKNKMNLNKLVIENANFSLLRNEIKILNEYTNYQFPNNKVRINNSNVFFKNNLNETITIIKIKAATFFYDNEKKINLFNLKGTTFGVPFTFDINTKDNSFTNKVFNFNARSLKLNIFNESIAKDKDSIIGKNIISFLNSKIKTKYNIKEKLINFESDNSRLNTSKIDYTGNLSINPFDLDLDIDLGEYRISKLFNFNSILKEFIKTGLPFNDNLSLDLSLLAKTNSLDEIFQKTKINLNIINGKFNLNDSIFVNNKMGLLKLINSNLFIKNNELILNTDILITIKDTKSLFTFLNTNKKFRKEIKDILINLDYNFLSNEIKFNNFKIDNKNVSNELLDIIEGFNEIKVNNLIKSRRLLNKLFDVYEG